MKLARSFYERPDVVTVARELLGKELCVVMDGQLTTGIITETEAYAGITDRASHAFGGKRTARTEIMYARGGTAYVYLCYGMHSLFNVVTNVKDVPHAVLIRAILPRKGISTMKARTGKNVINGAFSNGPGKVAKALGIHYSHSGLDLLGKAIWISDAGLEVPDDQVLCGPRIGVDYAGDDAKLPYRFCWNVSVIK